MKCKNCSGNGRVTIGWDSYPCDFCHGTGEIEQTNEEWRKTCSAEEFAEWIATQCGDAVMESTYDVSKLRKKMYWLDWLKEKHNGV